MMLGITVCKNTIDVIFRSWYQDFVSVIQAQYINIKKTLIYAAP